IKEFLWLRAPKIVTVLIALALGWVGAASSHDLAATMGWARVAVFLGGGVVYSAGALIYALKRPNPAPATFGYHEIFHLLVVVADAGDGELSVVARRDVEELARHQVIHVVHALAGGEAAEELAVVREVERDRAVGARDHEQAPRAVDGDPARAVGAAARRPAR